MLFPGVTLCHCVRVTVCMSGSEISSSYRRSSLVVDDLWRKRLQLLQEVSWILDVVVDLLLFLCT